MIISTLSRLLGLDGQPVASQDTVRIYAAVGPGCGNQPRDVRIVQDLLNRGASAGLAVDGAFGSKTAAAIVDFQRGFLSRPDGRVDPDGVTLRRLIAATRSESGPPKRTPQEAAGPTDGLRLVQLPQGGTNGIYSYATGEYQWGTDRTIQMLLTVGDRKSVV
jgi:peptidoglycan hydrolase-like protein with peptidoglycan-binding domain